MHDRLNTQPDETRADAARGVGVRVAAVRRVFDGGVVALDGIDLDVPPGQFLAILGPSGCGKSTLLRLIAGLDEPQAGTIALDYAVVPSGPPRPVLRERVRGEGERQVASEAERPANSSPSTSALTPTLARSTGRGGAEGGPRPRGRDLAYVFQDAHLLPWRTVRDNVALPLELAGMRKPDRLAAAADAIARVGLADAAGRYPNQLSGGMRMRVSLARALVTRPRLLLLDEPFAALDEITRQHLDEQLRALWRGTGMTVIFVTHSTSEAVFLAERAVVMTRRPGRVVADHRIDLPPERPAALRGADAFARQTRVLYEALERGGA